MVTNNRPARLSFRLPMLSCGSGGVPGATVKLTKLVTWYVPLAVGLLLESKVCQVPPPVTSRLPKLLAALKVPSPVSVIEEPSLAIADACPPALKVPVEKSTLMMSHRYFWPAALVRVTNSALPRSINTSSTASHTGQNLFVFMSFPLHEVWCNKPHPFTVIWPASTISLKVRPDITRTSVVPGPPATAVAVKGTLEPAPRPVTLAVPLNTAVVPLTLTDVIGPVTYIALVSKLPLPAEPGAALGVSARHSKWPCPLLQ